MDVSVCIVNWNTKDILSDCINSILNKTSGISFEIIIVDNASSDGSAEMVSQKFPQCKLIASKDNLGFSRGNNLALSKATGKYIFFLNPDTILATNAIYGMFRFMELNAEYGAVGCKLLNQDDSIQFICARTFPTLWNQFCYLTMLDRLFPESKIVSTIEMRYWDHLDSRDVDCLSGACIFARKHIIDKLDGFDGALFMYAEDVDLCYRIKKDGWSIHYLSCERIYHLEGQSSARRSQKFFSTIAQRESNQYFFLKHHGKFQAHIYPIVILTGSLFRLVLILISTIDFRKNQLTKHQRADIISKYWNLALWSMRFVKINKS